MVAYILLALVKIIDNIISTAKNICVYKEKKLMSSILTIISSLIFYLIIGEVIEDSTALAIIIVSISSGIGNFIAMAVDSKCRKAAKWTYVISSHNEGDIRNLCLYLARNKIKYIACDGYTRRGEHTINVLAFSKSKDDSRLIYSFLKSTGNKYLIEII